MKERVIKYGQLALAWLGIGLSVWFLVRLLVAFPVTTGGIVGVGLLLLGLDCLVDRMVKYVANAAKNRKAGKNGTFQGR